jgi:hypothetical protein
MVSVASLVIEVKDMSRSRALSTRDIGRVHVLASAGQHNGTDGALAAASWLHQLGSTTPTTTRWHVEIRLDVMHARAPSEWEETTATRFHLDVYAEEWGYYVCHGGHASWIRITDVPFVHGRDDFKLLSSTPALRDIGSLVRRIETEYSVQFQREHAMVRTNVAGIEPSVRRWIARL